MTAPCPHECHAGWITFTDELGDYVVRCPWCAKVGIASTWPSADDPRPSRTPAATAKIEQAKARARGGRHLGAP